MNPETPIPESLQINQYEFELQDVSLDEISIQLLLDSSSSFRIFYQSLDEFTRASIPIELLIAQSDLRIDWLNAQCFNTNNLESKIPKTNYSLLFLPNEIRDKKFKIICELLKEKVRLKQIFQDQARFLRGELEHETNDVA